jgi:5-methyltetrahydrofolate--homocysteine methyltransferase
LVDNYNPPKPSFLGTKVFEDYDLAELRKYIDWTPFFSTWELHGKYPNILEDKIVGEEAKKLLADANALLDKIIAEKWLTAKAVVGFFEANSNTDDIIITLKEMKAALYIICASKIKKAKVCQTIV